MAVKIADSRGRRRPKATKPSAASPIQSKKGSSTGIASSNMRPVASVSRVM